MKVRHYITNGHEENRFIDVVENQKVLKIHKYTDGIDYSAHNKARKELTSNAFELYDYIVCHSNEWIWALSSKDVCNESNLTMNKYPKAVAELIDKKYLIAGEIDLGSEQIVKNCYHFYESPELCTKIVNNIRYY